VLILGAAVGGLVRRIQTPKAFGAEVTGACSAHKHGHGALHSALTTLIDLAGPRDFRAGTTVNDLILDTAAYGLPRTVSAALTPDGTYVLVGGSTARFFQVNASGRVLVSEPAVAGSAVLASNPNPVRSCRPGGSARVRKDRAVYRSPLWPHRGSRGHPCA